MSKQVIIDGVRYVPATEVSTDAKNLLRALAATWWGWDAKEIDDPETYKYLKVIVTESPEYENDGQTLEDFVAELSMHPTGADHAK